MVIDADTKKALKRSVHVRSLAEIITYSTFFALGMFVNDAFAYWAILVALSISVTNYQESNRP